MPAGLQASGQSSGHARTPRDVAVGGFERALLAACECRDGAQAEALTDHVLAWTKEAMAEYHTQRTDQQTDAAASGN